MRPRISYSTKNKMESLVHDLQDGPETNMDTDQQIKFLIRYIMAAEYGPMSVPPWRKEEIDRERQRRREQKKRRERQYTRSGSR